MSATLLGDLECVPPPADSFHVVFKRGVYRSRAGPAPNMCNVFPNDPDVWEIWLGSPTHTLISNPHPCTA
eukprot:9471333-Pyramimonas_sp.AAC.1